MEANRVVLRLAIAVLVLAILLGVLTPHGAVRALGRADSGLIGMALLVSLLGVAIWGLALALLLYGVRGAPRGTAFVGGYSLGLFLRSIVPWGRAGGAVFAAYGLRRVSSADYERLLASTLTADFLRFLASMVVAASGLLALLVRGEHASDLLPLAAAMGAAVFLCVGVAAALIVAPLRATYATMAVAGLLRSTIGRVSGTLREALGREAVLEHTSRFFDTVNDIVERPLVVTASLVLCLIGWTLSVLPLYLTLQAVGSTVGLPIVAFVVPAAGLAGLAPLPGGTGGIEVATVGLLALLGGVDVGAAGAAALLARVATFWTPMTVAGFIAVIGPAGPSPRSMSG
jgi:uncharacterized protein (TIRG00374 family)